MRIVARGICTVVHVYTSSFVYVNLYTALCICWFIYGSSHQLYIVVCFYQNRVFLTKTYISIHLGIWCLYAVSKPMATDFHIWQMGDFNYEKYQTSENSYNINNYGYYSIWNYAIYGNNLPYKIYNRHILCWLRYDTGVDCFTSFWY